MDSVFKRSHEAQKETIRIDSVGHFLTLPITQQNFQCSKFRFNDVHRELSLQPPNPLWPQTISRLIFEDSLAKRLSEKRSKGAVSTEESAVIQADQENALRYAAGFVPFKLLKKYKKKDTEEAAAIVNCLSNMAVQVEESSFLAYTSEWIKAINRGGLFECTDASYHFFRCMEIEMRTAMKGHVVGSTVADSEIISSVCSSESVLSQ